MNIEKKGVKLREAQSVLQECRKGCRDLGCFPLDVFDASNDCISRTLNVVDECKKMSRKVHQRGAHEPDSSALNSSLSSAVERLLIAFQNFCHESPISEENAQRADSKDTEQQEDYSILDCHKGIIERWANINLKELNGKLGNVIDQLRCIHDTVGINGEQREAFVGLVSDMNILSDYVQSLSKSYLQDSLKFYFSTSKFLYVILRVFRVLISKGYCADETSEEDDGDGEGDINGMTFEDDQDGTGMGEGEGKKDVTDQLENEDQLAGLKSDQDNSEDKPENQESKQLNEDEADQGMEMENDFDGDMCDLPDKEPDDEMEEQEGEEELDREMGEDASPDEQVVDERMWNESDDEDDINKEEEKFEKDSKVEGEAIEGETRTKEDDEGNDPSKDDKKEDDSKPDQQNPHGDDNLGDTLDMDQEDEEDRINEDNDNVEEQNGIDVQGNEQEQQDEENNDGDMQLDDDVCLDGEEDEGAEEPSAELDAEVDENQEDAESVGSEVNENQGDTEAPEDDDEVDPNNAITSQGQGTVEQDDEAKDENEPQEEPPEENALESMKQEPSTEEAHGIKSNQGTDAVMEDGADENNEEKDDNGEEDAGGTSGASQALDSQPDDSGQGGGYSERDGALDNPAETNGQQNADEIPNPFKDPGDASKFWHKKLNMVDSNPDNESEGGAEEDAAKEEEGLEQKTEGDFEYAPQEQKNSTQVLGEATEEEAKKLDQMHNDKEEEETEINETENGKKSEQEESQNQKHNKPSSRQSKKLDSMDQDNEEGINNDEMMSDVDDEVMDDLSEVSKGQEDNGDDEIVSGNLVGSDLSKLIVGDNEDVELFDPSKLIQDEQATGISSAEGAEARLKWLQIQGETHNLARRLCEKLRLVMEPLVASKLRGDYRTGKRINMKRVIGYIASGYRKDKIWLRRTKPAKRDYRVLLAVDDSESMKKSGAGDMALRAMATLAVGMNQLEIGELGIASFGEDMKLLHPYHLPFTSESGSDMVTNFKFNQQRTRTALCVESALASLEQYGDNSSMQLVFLISDGRIERDSRAALKRLMREMAERNILLAMIIVEGKNKKKDSIVHMKEVTFEKGKPVVKRFIEDYPFPYYIILEDMSALPEVLGDALKQWFEMLAQLNSAK
jgi:midasin